MRWVTAFLPFTNGEEYAFLKLGALPPEKAGISMNPVAAQRPNPPPSHSSVVFATSSTHQDLSLADLPPETRSRLADYSFPSSLGSLRFCESYGHAPVQRVAFSAGPSVRSSRFSSITSADGRVCTRSWRSSAPRPSGRLACPAPDHAASRSAHTVFAS